MAVAGALLVVGCGGSTVESNGDSNGDDPNPSATVDGGGGDTGANPDGGQPMSVSDAAARETGAVVTVEGYLIEDSGALTVSDSIAESYPPQPGGPSMQVEGIDLSQMAGVNEVGPIRWLDNRVTITGTIADGRIVDAAVAD